MARAFFDDPPFVWILRSPTTRERRLRRFFLTCLRADALGREQVAVVEVARSGERLVGGAIWYPPSHWPPAQRGGWAALAGYVRAFGRRLGPATALVQTMARVHPHQPHWYLAYIGVEPDWQGRGVGSALLRSRLAICDEELADAYLESSKLANVPLYQHFGFQPTGVVPAPSGAPPITAMSRPAPAR